jgi:hypothetical protein
VSDTEQTAPQAVLWGQIQGTDITFPMEVADFDVATLLFTVPASAAAALVPGEAFEVVEVADGRAQLVMALCDYHQNPWGDYLEVNLGFLARPAGAPAEVIGSFVYRMPVDQAFTCQAGNEVMGFPKTVEDLAVDHVDGRVTFTMSVGGVPELAVSFPAVAAMGDAARVETDSYSYLDGRPYATPLSMDMGTGLIDPADVRIELGSGAVADELRTLGLPTAPDFATWGTHLTATFQLGRPLA